MNKYITRIYGMAGTVEKADRDFADFSEEIGWEILPIHRYDDKNETDREMGSRLDGVFARVKRGDIVIHQYPSWNSIRFEKRILSKIKGFGAHAGIMVHDIPNWINGPKKWNSTFPEEYAMQFDFMIVHTERMAERFRERGYTKPIFCNYFFDYAADTPIPKMQFLLQVFTAGNPRKSAKLFENWSCQAKLLAYGPNHDNMMDNLPESIDYRGLVSADDLPLEFNGGFGLVYYEDNPEDDTWAAKYASFNGPHKLSSYLAAGLPVIVESYMPTVDFIETHKLGFAITDISEIDGRIAAISEEEYRQMARNAKHFAHLLRTGYFTKRVMSEVAGYAFS